MEKQHSWGQFKHGMPCRARHKKAGASAPKGPAGQRDKWLTAPRPAKHAARGGQAQKENEIVLLKCSGAV